MTSSASHSQHFPPDKDTDDANEIDVTWEAVQSKIRAAKAAAATAEALRVKAWALRAKAKTIRATTLPEVGLLEEDLHTEEVSDCLPQTELSSAGKAAKNALVAWNAAKAATAKSRALRSEANALLTRVRAIQTITAQASHL
jgi:hypothetical protein